jgi:thiamine biosynthesis lipoprotein
VLVDFEVWDVLRTCRDYARRTGGSFDVTARPGGAPSARDTPFLLDENRRTVSFTRPDATIDLGGFGKGYALDRVGELLRAFHVVSGLIHGGTSSILAVGAHPDGHPWPVGLRDPFAEGDESAVLGRLYLTDQGLSCSAVFSPGRQESDVIDPLRGEPLTEQAACVVVAPTALEAEILSTALLSMAKERALAYTRKEVGAAVHVGWIEQIGRPCLTWLTEAS